MVFENMVLRKMSEHKREDVTRGRRELYSEELDALYS